MVGQGLGEGWREVCGMMAKLCNGIGVGAGGVFDFGLTFVQGFWIEIQDSG